MNNTPICSNFGAALLAEINAESPPISSADNIVLAKKILCDIDADSDYPCDLSLDDGKAVSQAICELWNNVVAAMRICSHKMQTTAIMSHVRPVELATDLLVATVKHIGCHVVQGSAEDVKRASIILTESGSIGLPEFEFIFNLFKALHCAHITNSTLLMICTNQSLKDLHK
jgi:hypothetical protein